MRHWGLLRYGLLKTTGQADGFRVLKVKTSYYAIQNAVSVFNDALKCLSPQHTSSTLQGAENCVVYDWEDRETGTPVVVFWDASAMPSNENITRKATVSVKGKPIQNPVWVDLLTGNVYKISESQIGSSGERTTYSVPVYDSPTFITSQDILTLDKSWFVREGKNMKRYH